VSGAAVGSRAALAQQSEKLWRVGFLTLNSPSLVAKSTAAFVKGMRELGYVEGRNLIIEWRFAEGNFERLPDFATELVRLKVDVIVAVASAAIGAAQKATSTIPIVMATTGDPVGSGFVKSLSRPGGNVTGLSNMSGDTAGKLFDLLLTVVPKPSRVGVLVTPTSTTYRAILDSITSAARQAGVNALVVEASTPLEIENAFGTMARERVSAVIVGSAPLFGVQRHQIVDLALRHRIPSIFGVRAYAEAGGLISYGADLTVNYVRAAVYVDKIFKGAKPADLPVEQPAEFELVVNMRTATKLGITIPQTILLRANEVIR
jgi:putative ABC transport system substrate-binding protein